MMFAPSLPSATVCAVCFPPPGVLLGQGKEFGPRAQSQALAFVNTLFSVNVYHSQGEVRPR